MFFYFKPGTVNEASVIKQKWTTVVPHNPSGSTGKTKFSIEMYTFRFATSSSVTIKCSAYVWEGVNKNIQGLKQDSQIRLELSMHDKGEVCFYMITLFRKCKFH